MNVNKVIGEREYKMKELLKVSIIIPVHDSEKTLSRCVESIIFQKYKNIECILVENGSSDNSKDLCYRYSTKYENIIAVAIKENGVSNARNKALSIATGDIIGFCDADDFIEDDAIEVIVQEFERDSNIKAVFGAFYVGKYDNKKIKKQYLGLKTQKLSINKAVKLTLVNDRVMGSLWNKYYRSDVIKKQLFNQNLSFCEDMHFNIKVLNSLAKTNGGYIKLIEHPLYCYMENPQSVTHKESLLFDENNNLKYIVSMKQIMQDCKLNKKMLSLVKMRIACFSIDTLVQLNLDSKKKNKLLYELKKNYLSLIANIWVNNWKQNLKRLYKGAKFIVQSIWN